MNANVIFTELRLAAEIARKNAYAPYSGFAVGAAVEGASGRIYSGCNVENASFGLTICAERAAIFHAVSAGEFRMNRLLLITDSKNPATPCGACRQVMQEFSIEEVFMCNLRGETRTVLLNELLPLAFGPAHLKGESL